MFENLIEALKAYEQVRREDLELNTELTKSVIVNQDAVIQLLDRVEKLERRTQTMGSIIKGLIKLHEGLI